MRRQLLALGTITSLAIVLAVSCGGLGSSSSNGPTGTVAFFGADAPICDVISFDVTISGATLTPQGGGNPVTLISGSNPVTVDFAALMDFFTVLNISSTVPPGTYSQLNLTLTSPQLTILDTTKSPPAPTQIPTSLTNSTPTVDIDPPLVVDASGTVALTMDFKLRKSVQLNASGQVTGVVNPVIIARSNPSRKGEVGDVDELRGIIKTVTPTPSDPNFIGNIVVQTDSGNTPTVQLTSNTKCDDIGGGDSTGASCLSKLTVMLSVEVNAFVDSNGNIVAKNIEAEEQEDQQRAAFVGDITAIGATDGMGSVTQFTLFVRHQEPDETTCVPPKTNLQVNVNSFTEFHINAAGQNRSGLSFDGTNLGLGQIVVVHGVCKQTTPPSIDATSIRLKLQTIVGNCQVPPLNALANDKTGGFTFIPCGAVFQGLPITVFTYAETAFAGVAGLNELKPAPIMVAVKGLLIYTNPTQVPAGINGIPIPTPVSPATSVPVVEAALVHQLEK